MKQTDSNYNKNLVSDGQTASFVQICAMEAEIWFSRA